MYRWEEWALANVDREALYRHVPRLPALTGEPRQCRCGTGFTPVNRNQVWCSANCRSRYAMKMKRMRDARSVSALRDDDLLVLAQ